MEFLSAIAFIVALLVAVATVLGGALVGGEREVRSNGRSPNHI